MRLEKQRLVCFMENFHIADGNSAHCVPVIRIAQIDKILFLRVPRIIPVLERNFNGRLHRCRAVVGIEHLVQSFRRYFHKLFRQLRRRLVDQSQQCAVLHFVQFRNNGFINFPAAVSVDVDPQTGNSIQIFFSFCIVQLYAVPVIDNQLRIFQPAFHLRKRMPDIFFIQFFPFIHDVSLLVLFLLPFPEFL